MFYRLLIITLLGFLVFLNVVLFDLAEFLYYLLLLSSIVGSYAITRGFVSSPR